MFGFGLHTSTDVLGLGLQDGDALIVGTWPEGRKLAETLHSRIQEILAGHPWSELGWVAVCLGPGSFTGTRIGVITVRTIAQALNIPTIGISALAAIAEASQIEGDIAVSLDARRGDRFAALFRRDPENLFVLRTDILVEAPQWADWLATLPEATTHIDGDSISPLPIAALMTLANRQFEQNQTQPWQTLEPFYGRPAPIHPGAL
ncbi:MAG: tRNA (adenosine(37)-N6)-threonylcarbamoyltransferase complex dimerization subunit type 1 TsaB [Anaerolineae bacterium]|nr:tRNA (adenosine(37)-N6)-threonylcarbamoyltransferase complex dimerization subunit type 1 TsaB [Gloeobacterales cyanobacterium ES-bin-313]